MKVTISAPAKVNLFLEITGRRSDGYHILDTVMQSVSLYDEVTVSIEEDQEGISLSCNNRNIPCDETNTAWRAALKFWEYTEKRPGGLHIHIRKNIPSQAGMAGGSTDAAAVLLAMNELYDAQLETSELAHIAEEIGADVPFCLYGGTMLAGGIGTILTPLPDMPDCWILIVKPDVMISTSEAYKSADLSGYRNIRNSDRLVEHICSGDVGGIGRSLFNRFENISKVPELAEIKGCMEQFGAAGACMTGSGSAVFGLFEDKDEAEDCEDILKNRFKKVYLVKPESAMAPGE